MSYQFFFSGRVYWCFIWPVLYLRVLWRIFGQYCWSFYTPHTRYWVTNHGVIWKSIFKCVLLQEVVTQIFFQIIPACILLETKSMLNCTLSSWNIHLVESLQKCWNLTRKFRNSYLKREGLFLLLWETKWCWYLFENLHILSVCVSFKIIVSTKWPFSLIIFNVRLVYSDIFNGTINVWYENLFIV